MPLEDFLRTGHLPGLSPTAAPEDVRRVHGDPRDQGRRRRALILSYDGLEFHFQGKPLRLALVHIEPRVTGVHRILGDTAWLLGGEATVASVTQKLNELGIAWHPAEPHVTGGVRITTGGNVGLYFEDDGLTAMSLVTPSNGPPADRA